MTTGNYVGDIIKNINETMKSSITCAVILLATVTACHDEEYFNQADYENIVADAFPVTDIDGTHDWTTATTVTATIDLTDTYDGDATVKIYGGAPDNTDSRLYTTALADGATTVMFSLPTDNNGTVYATATDSNDSTIMCGTFAVDGTHVDISPDEGDALTDTQDTPADTPMEYTYCFENDFPVPGDYDFNDVVMTVSMTKSPDGTTGNSTGKDIIYLTVTLRAVGATDQMAGCIRLVGTTSSILTSTYACPTEEFFLNSDIANENYVPVNEKSNRTYASANATGEMCIVLFNDAHYAISGIDADVENYGVRVAYNTSDDDETGDNTVEEKTNVYKITFNSSGGYTFKYFSMEDIDPFVITAYNGTYYEVHTYQYKTGEVMHYWRTGVTGDTNDYYTDNYPWALAVPGTFAYPTEGTAIGIYSGNVLSGAYQTSRHSFGEWAQDHTQAVDWYDYPNSSLTY